MNSTGLRLLAAVGLLFASAMAPAGEGAPGRSADYPPSAVRPPSTPGFAQPAGCGGAEQCSAKPRLRPQGRVSAVWDGPAQHSLPDILAEEAPLLDRQVLERAVAAMRCAVAGGAGTAQRLAVIDYSRPSSEPRLWVFDLAAGKLLHEELVAHGQGSGENLATRFSNRPGSHQSSLGLFRTAESYFGQHGQALRMDGLEPGVNDQARERAIVIHGASYVDARWVAQHGRLGRSHGCPAVRSEVAGEVVESLKGGQFLFAYYPDRDWLASSPYLNCQAGGRLAAAEEEVPGS